MQYMNHKLYRRWICYALAILIGGLAAVIDHIGGFHPIGPGLLVAVCLVVGLAIVDLKTAISLPNFLQY